MDNTTIETVVETTDVEQPKKPKREKPVPGRKRGASDKGARGLSLFRRGHIGGVLSSLV